MLLQAWQLPGDQCGVSPAPVSLPWGHGGNGSWEQSWELCAAVPRGRELLPAAVPCTALLPLGVSLCVPLSPSVPPAPQDSPSVPVALLALAGTSQPLMALMSLCPLEFAFGAVR